MRQLDRSTVPAWTWTWFRGTRHFSWALQCTGQPWYSCGSSGRSAKLKLHVGESILDSLKNTQQQGRGKKDNFFCVKKLSSSLWTPFFVLEQLINLPPFKLGRIFRIKQKKVDLFWTLASNPSGLDFFISCITPVNNRSCGSNNDIIKQILTVLNSWISE